MTISTTESRISYNGNGVTTVFTIPFRFLVNGDIVVVSVSAAGVETTKTLTTDYTLTGAGDDAGGSVTMLVAPANGTRLIIYRDTEIVQETDYISGDPFPAETHERALDRLTMIAQEISPNVDRAIRVPVGDSSSLNTTLPAAVDRLDKFIVFDATTGETELSTVTQTEVASAVAAAYAAGSTADAVTFLQSDTGAVAQTVQEKVRRVEWSPEDFGAAETYDSTVDDRPFLELARDAVFNAGGGTVILNRKYALNSFETSYVMLRPKTGVSWKGKNKYRCGLRVGDGLRSTSQGITVLYDHTNFIYDIEMSNFFVDFNGQNNLLLAGYGSSGRVNRLGGNIAADVTCRDMVFKNSAGHHFIWFGLASVDSRNDNCEVINCSFLECGQSISGNETTDHSSIYLGCTGGRVIGNKFKNTTQDYVATAIEVHSNDALVSDNWVQMFNHGANIGGDSNTQSGTQFANNIFRAVVRGIVVWTGDTYTVDLLSITGNTITLVDPEGTIYAPGGGIVYTGSFDTSTATSSGWVIANNDISMESNHTAALTYANTGIGINPVNGLLIEGNRVNGLKAEGVRLDVVATKNHTNATVRNNSIVGCGFTTAAGRRQGIHALSNAATYIDTNTTIEGNQIVAGHVGSGVDMDYGIALNGTGQFQNLRILDNDVVGASIQDIYTPTAQTQTTKPYIRHETSGAGHPLNLAIRAGWGSTWVNKASGYSFEFRNKAGTNGSEDGWNATVYGVGDPNSTSPFNTAGTAWKKGDTYIEASPDAGTAKSWRCTTAGTSAPAAAVWTEV